MSSAPPQLSISNTFVRAGAGAGKTTELVSVFIQFAKTFMEQNQRAPKIVLTTFTRKATQELKERLLLKCLETNEQEIFHLVNQKSKIHISTIHGVLSLFLSQYGSYLGLSPDFTIMDEAEEDFLIKSIFRQAFKQNPDYAKLQECFSIKSLLSITKVLYCKSFEVEGLQALSEKEIFEHIEQFNSSKNAEIVELADTILESTDVAGWVEYAQALKKAFTQESLETNVQTFLNFGLSKPRYSKAKPPVDEALNESVEEAQKFFKEVRENKWLELNSEAQKELAQVHQDLDLFFNHVRTEILRKKIETSVVTMSDLELFSIQLLNDYPEVKTRFSQSWDYWMIDEYQDTSPLQVKILDQLIGDTPYFMVGDPQQSIYSFRGARREVFENRKNLILKEKQNFQEKQINYRSSPSLLGFINDLFVSMKTQFQEMQINPEPKFDDKSAVRLVLNQQEESNEYERIVHEIRHYLAKGIAAEEICVISKINSSLEQLAYYCRHEKVPVQLHANSAFYEKREVQDLLSFLKFLKNPHDDLNLMILLRQPWFRVEDHVIWEHKQKAPGSLWSHYQFPKLQEYRRLAYQIGASLTLQKMIVDEEVIDFCQFVDPSGRREANIWKFVNDLAQAEKQSGFDLLEFVNHGRTDLDSETQESSEATPVIEPKRVNLMTVHASKGLQFEAVIVVNIQNAPSPDREHEIFVDEKNKRWSVSYQSDHYEARLKTLMSRDIKEEIKKRNLEEFERVYYVAVSRAKKYVSLMADLGTKKINENSWLAKTKLTLSEGTHQEPEYHYEVLTDNKHNYKHLNELTVNSVRPVSARMEFQKAEKENTRSVTDMVSQTTVRRLDSHWIQNIQKATSGTRIHRLFEVLKFRPDYIESLKDENFQKALAYMKKQTMAPIMQIIEEGHVEWGFAVQLEDGFIQGQIDLWGRLGDKVYIVDYKTGSSFYKDKAFEQLEIYKKALKRIYGSAFEGLKFELVVIYPFEEQTFVLRD